MSESLHGYQLVEKLREGASSVVWKALGPLQQQVAVKVLTPAAAADRASVKAFRRGAKYLQLLSHPQLLKVHEIFPGGPLPCCTMEVFSSDHLKLTMRQFPGRVFKQEFSILRKIADALGRIHEQGIVHDDLRPENVLIGATSEIRLAGLDYAVTRFERFLNAVPKPLGLPQYAAPERLAGRRIDFRSDFYSLGVLMYELLTKQLPFEAFTEKGVLEKQLREYPDLMRSHIPSLAPELDTFLWRLIARNPDDRFQSINEILAELYKFEWAETRVRVRQTRRLEPPPTMFQA